MSEATRRLILAVDFPSPAAAETFIDGIGTPPVIYKIGLELIYAGGINLARRLAQQGQRVFVDAKLHDIGNTVERSVASIIEMGAEFVTVHAADAKTLSGAVAGRKGAQIKLLGVTVLTNLEEADIPGAKDSGGVPALVLARARLARDAGLDGVVASAWEAPRLRAELGPDFLIVTPGIRPLGAAAGDQTRISTPAAALDAGADYLVVGRPVTQAPDPRAALEGILTEIARAAG